VELLQPRAGVDEQSAVDLADPVPVGVAVTEDRHLWPVGEDQIPARSRPPRTAKSALTLNSNRNGTSAYRRRGFISR